jgi:phosphoglycerate-specific signal transduction histidine kinase
VDRKKVSDEKSLSEIQVMKETAEAELLKRQGVTGVDIGYKYVNGKKTDEIAIRVLVEEKKKDISKDEKIPETVDGIKTDVIQRKLVLHSKKIPVAEFSPQADNGK